MNGAADRAAAAFRAEFGTDPTGVWVAPGRVNLIGEHTDYTGGFVLPFALPLVTAVAAGPGPAGEWTVRSEHLAETVRFGLDDLVPGRIPGWAAYPAGVVWALTEAGHLTPGARLLVASDVPLGAGLSSSAALECAALTALVDLGGQDLPDGDRPRLAQRHRRRRRPPGRLTRPRRPPHTRLAGSPLDLAWTALVKHALAWSR